MPRGVCAIMGGLYCSKVGAGSSTHSASSNDVDRDRVDNANILRDVSVHRLSAPALWGSC